MLTTTLQNVNNIVDIDNNVNNIVYSDNDVVYNIVLLHGYKVRFYFVMVTM